MSQSLSVSLPVYQQRTLFSNAKNQLQSTHDILLKPHRGHVDPKASPAHSGAVDKMRQVGDRVCWHTLSYVVAAGKAALTSHFLCVLLPRA